MLCEDSMLCKGALTDSRMPCARLQYNAFEEMMASKLADQQGAQQDPPNSCGAPALEEPAAAVGRLRGACVAQRSACAAPA